MSNLKEKIINNFNEHTEMFETAVSQKRKKAIDLFKTNGFPTLKHEDWKYSNVAFLNRIEFNLNPKSESFSVGNLNDIMIPGISVNILVFVNGKFSPNLSSFVESSGIKISSLRNELDNGNEIVSEKLGTLVDLEKHSFGQINTAFVKDGLFVHVPKNQVLEKPIHIINIADASSDAVIINTRNLFVIDNSAFARVVISNKTFGDKESLINNVNEIFVGDNAKMDLYQIQNDGLNSNYINLTEVKQGKDSKLIDNTVSVSGNFIRNDLRTEIGGQNSETFYNGLYVNDGKTHVDNHTFVDHAVPHCHSNEFYKGIMDERSKAVFNGKVLVRRDAQKTDAYQQNRNIVLSDTASINTKPELEIYADDVKCSHGATTGKLDEEALFYMRQRGLDTQLAKSLLMYTFCYEIIERMESEEMRSYVGELIHNKLGV